jgi:hypothetical protein
MFQTKVVGISKHTFYDLFFNRAVYETIWKNTVQPERPQMTIWRKRIACWTPNATDTHPQYVTVIAFSLQQWLHERASVTYVGTVPVLLYARHLSST